MSDELRISKPKLPELELRAASRSTPAPRRIESEGIFENIFVSSLTDACICLGRAFLVLLKHFLTSVCKTVAVF